METKNIKQWADFNATAEQLYDALMTSEGHTAFTKSEAEIDPTVGGKFKTWDGYIQGKNLELERGKKIVQEWRSDEKGWPEDHFSKITIKFKDGKDGKTRILFWQSGIPAECVDDIEQGWKDYYWTPLKEYFK